MLGTYIYIHTSHIRPLKRSRPKNQNERVINQTGFERKQNNDEKEWRWTTNEKWMINYDIVRDRDESSFTYVCTLYVCTLPYLVAVDMYTIWYLHLWYVPTYTHIYVSNKDSSILFLNAMGKAISTPLIATTPDVSFIPLEYDNYWDFLWLQNNVALLIVAITARNSMAPFRYFW